MVGGHGARRAGFLLRVLVGGKETLGGEPALAWTDACSDGYNVNKLAALHGRRGYMIFMLSPTTNDEAVDRRIFESIRRSFRFTR